MPKQATHRQPDTSPLTDYIQQRIREGVFIITLASSLFLLLALSTYHSSDPGWSHIDSSSHILNAGGRIGAWCADVMLYLFGYVAYLFPFMVIYTAWFFIHRPLEHGRDYVLLVLKITGFFMVVAGGCGLVSLEWVGSAPGVPFTAGGIVGQLVGFGLVKLVNLLGALLLLLSLLLAGITLLIEFCWGTVIESIGFCFLYTVKMLGKTVSAMQKLISTADKTASSHADDKTEPVFNDSNVVADAKTSQPVAVKPALLTERIEPIIELKREPKLDIMPLKRAKKIEQVVDNVPVINPANDQDDADLSNPSATSLPSLDLLDAAVKSTTRGYSNVALETMSREVEQRLLDFGVEAQVVAVHPGPVITRFELQLAPGIKVSKISGLAKDLARSLSVISVRIVEIIPGKSVIGLELPNEHRETVRLRDVLSSEQYEQAKSPLSMALGKDIAGHPVIVDLGKMPHLLVAGTTGSGKSVGLNVMLLSILYKALPEDVRMILIDPKMLELSVYDNIPHLLAPVVTNMKEAANALRWCVAEMERRYRLMASLGVRNLAGFNQRVREASANGRPLTDPLWQPKPLIDEGEPPALNPLPYIVVVVDEFADMMMVVGKKVEELIARIAQKARAAGIHLILATQRPSVDVITGLIKANVPTRIAFQVSSRIDSRTILDQQGAEQLLGQGDMLYLPPGSGVPVRVHGAFVDDHEVHRVVKDWKKRGRPDYIEEILSSPSLDNGENGFSNGEGAEETDELYDEAVRIVTETRRASISHIQRRLRIGFNRAARLLEEMEQAGVVSAMESNGIREVLAPPPPTDVD